MQKCWFDAFFVIVCFQECVCVKIKPYSIAVKFALTRKTVINLDEESYLW